MTRQAVAMLTPGPVATYPAVQRAMARPVPFDYDPDFRAFYESVARKAARALRVADPGLILQFEPAPAIEAAVASLVGRGDVVLCLVSGVYGAGFSTLARRFAREVLEVAAPFDRAIDPADVAAALRARSDVGVVTVVHHETPTGTLNPLDDIGAVVRAHGALLLVDAVSSFAGMDVHPAASGADLFVTGPAKCLGGAPGLTLAAVSDRAWAHMQANPAAPRGSVLSLLDWREAWRPNRPFPFTPSIADVFGLDAALDLYLAEGPPAVWARHALTARACRAGVQALGLRLWPASEAIASPTTTVLRVPDGVDAAALLAVSRERLGVQMAGGRGATEGRVIRIGHMGAAGEPLHAVSAVAALAVALRQAGWRCDAGAGVEAALAAIA